MRQLASEGADIVDIGGESTAPGNVAVPCATELERILDTVRESAKESFISVDTYRAETAEAVLAAGAKMINDVSALRADPQLADIIGEFQAFVVLMHSKEQDHSPHASLGVKHYGDVVRETAHFLLRRAEFALSRGIAESKIILDPGMGRFLSHDSEYSWRMLEEFDRLVELVSPFPVLVAVSRKGFLPGKLAERDPISQLTGLAACVKGAGYLRTHCPGMARDFLQCWERLFKNSPPARFE